MIFKILTFEQLYNTCYMCTNTMYLLQNPADGFNRLKRVVMIGDHHQVFAIKNL